MASERTDHVCMKEPPQTPKGRASESLQAGEHVGMGEGGAGRGRGSFEPFPSPGSAHLSPPAVPESFPFTMTWWSSEQRAPRRPVSGSSQVIELLSGGRGLWEPQTSPAEAQGATRTCSGCVKREEGRSPRPRSL